MLFNNRRRQSEYTILEQPAQEKATMETSAFEHVATEQSAAHDPAFEFKNGNKVKGNGLNGNGAAGPRAQRLRNGFVLQNAVGSNHDEILALHTTQPILTFPTTTIDALRYMATRLLVNQELPKRTAIVAALREEGVTYNALAFATLLAYDTAKRICYVDLNWWHPYRPLQLATPQNRGLAALLQEQASWEASLVSTNYPNLWLLPAGVMAPHQRAMTARSAELMAVLDTLAAQFDHLILDLPAVLTTSDAIPLAALADAGCVVVRHGVSTSELTNRALKDLQHLPMLGVILNRTSTQIPAALLKWIPQE